MRKPVLDHSTKSTKSSFTYSGFTLPGMSLDFRLLYSGLVVSFLVLMNSDSASQDFSVFLVLGILILLLLAFGLLDIQDF